MYLYIRQYKDNLSTENFRIAGRAKCFDLKTLFENKNPHRFCARPGLKRHHLKDIVFLFKL